jgi:Rps23 Pro-64 3,4-dihydroxylase Tpa1-like proline 4-hydroxylase
MINPSISTGVEALSNLYNSAPNYPHIVLDDFLDETVAQTMAQQLWYLANNVEQEEWRWNNKDWHNDQVLKMGISDIEKMPDITQLVVNYFNGEQFLEFLQTLTGFEDLQADYTLRGGGVHATGRNGRLNVHNDFNFMTDLDGNKVYRKVNLLIYFNREWKKEWGGELELWEPSLENCFKVIDIIFNRAVIFNIENAPHGHPDPLTCPPGETRRSLAFYYYSKKYQNEKDLERAYWKYDKKLL